MMAMECVTCRDQWREISFDEYLDKMDTFTPIPGIDLFEESFCPTCRPIVVKNPRVLDRPEPPEHTLGQGDQILKGKYAVGCTCGHVYGTVARDKPYSSLDWKQINRDRLAHLLEVLEPADEQVAAT